MRPRPEVRAKPMARLANTIRNSNQGSLLAPRGRDDGGLPGELDVKAAVGACDEEEEAEVAGTDDGCADEDGAAGGAEDDGDDDVPEVFLAAGGGPGDAAGEDVGEGVGRRWGELAFDFGDLTGLGV